jgi:gamma-glutamyltranspeptidase/glutathione hydrolase
MGTRGAVASAHPLASMAGIETLLAGGNAVDAAVAVGSTLNVVEPFMSGVGGIGLMLVSRPGGERHVLDFIGAAPRAADVTRCTEEEQGAGPKACATPGNLGGWLTAHARFGRLPRGRVLEPAVGHAERGVPLTFKNVEFFTQALWSARRRPGGSTGPTAAPGPAPSSPTRTWRAPCARSPRAASRSSTAARSPGRSPARCRRPAAGWPRRIWPPSRRRGGNP